MSEGRLIRLRIDPDDGLDPSGSDSGRDAWMDLESGHHAIGDADGAVTVNDGLSYAPPKTCRRQSRHRTTATTAEPDDCLAPLLFDQSGRRSPCSMIERGSINGAPDLNGL